MDVEMTRLKATALGLWREAQLPGETAWAYLERKAALMKADASVLESLRQYVAHLDEGLALVSGLTPTGEPSAFVLAELDDFIELAQLGDARDAILERHRHRSATRADVHLPLAVISAEDATTLAPPPADASEASRGADSATATGDAEPDLTIWQIFMREAAEQVDALDQAQSKAVSAEALLRLDLPAQMRAGLNRIEALLGAEMVRRGHLSSEAAVFQAVSQPLLARAQHLHAALRHAIQEKRAAVSNFDASQRGDSRFVGSGTLGAVAAATTLNMVGGLFSGIRRRGRTSEFDSDLDRQIMQAAGPALDELLNDYADVLSAYYDVLARLGLPSASTMLKRMHDARHVLSNIAHIPGPEARLGVIEAALRAYPWVGLDWLSALAELVPMLGARVLPVLEAARPTTLCSRADMGLVTVLAALREGHGDQARHLAADLCGEADFGLQVANGPWPIASTEADLVLRTQLALRLVAADMVEYVPEDVVARVSLLRMLDKPRPKADTVPSLVNLLQSLKTKRWLDAASAVGHLRANTEVVTAHRVLEALVLGALAQDSQPGAMETVQQLCERLGLAHDHIAAHRRADGLDLLYLGLWGEIQAGRLARAQELEAMIPPDFVAPAVSLRVHWFGARDLPGRPPAAVLFRLARQRLRAGDMEVPHLTDDLLRLLYAARQAEALAPHWEDSAQRILGALASSDLPGVASELQEMANSAAPVLAAHLHCMALSLTGYDAQRDAACVERIVASGIRVNQLVGVMSDKALRDDIEKTRQALVASARDWQLARIEQTHLLAPQLIQLQEPSAHRLNDAQRRALCQHIEQAAPLASSYLLPEHLLACWIDAKASILVLAYGIVFVNRSGDGFGFLPLHELQRASRSGWINDYLKLESAGSAVEIPAQLSSELRPQHDLLIHLVNGLAEQARMSFRTKQLPAWNVLDPLDWVELVANGSRRSSYVVQFYMDDEHLQVALRIAAKEPDAPRELSAADSQDDARAQRLKDLRSRASSLAIARSGTLYHCANLDLRKTKEFAKRVLEKLPPFGFDAADILVYYDETVTGIGDRGVAICPRHLVWTVDGAGVFEWSQIASLTVSGMLNRKLEVHLKDARRFQMVLTQGNKEVDMLVAFARELLESPIQPPSTS